MLVAYKESRHAHRRSPPPHVTPPAVTTTFLLLHIGHELDKSRRWCLADVWTFVSTSSKCSFKLVNSIDLLYISLRQWLGAPVNLSADSSERSVGISPDYIRQGSCLCRWRITFRTLQKVDLSILFMSDFFFLKINWMWSYNDTKVMNTVRKCVWGARRR